MEALKKELSNVLVEGGSVDVHFDIMKPYITGKKTVMEIGFNTGYSAAFFLENGVDKVVSFDICQHGYEQKAHDIIEKEYPGKHTLVEGDSCVTLPEYPLEKFDFIFIDGYHWGKWPEADIRNCARFAHKDTIVIVDNISFKFTDGQLYSHCYSEDKIYNVTDAWNKLVIEGVIIPDRIECRYIPGDNFPSCMGIGKYDTQRTNIMYDGTNAPEVSLFGCSYNATAC